MAIDYKSAGVDVEAGYEAVRRMKKHAESTYDSRVLGGLGSFCSFASSFCHSSGGNAKRQPSRPLLITNTSPICSRNFAGMMSRQWAESNNATVLYRDSNVISSVGPVEAGQWRGFVIYAL